MMTRARRHRRNPAATVVAATAGVTIACLTVAGVGAAQNIPAVSGSDAQAAQLRQQIADAQAQIAQRQAALGQRPSTTTTEPGSPSAQSVPPVTHGSSGGNSWTAAPSGSGGTPAPVTTPATTPVTTPAPTPVPPTTVPAPKPPVTGGS